MKTFFFRNDTRVVLLIMGLMLGITAQSQDPVQKLFMGLELNNVLCGYSEVLLKEFDEDETNYLQIDQKTYFSFKALGRDISQKQIFTYKVDQKTGNFLYHDSYMEQGEQRMSASMQVEGDTIIISDPQEEGNRKIFLQDEVILPNIVFYPYLQKDFGLENKGSMTYTMFDVRSGKVREARYENAGREKIVLNDEEYDAVIVSESDPVTGLITKYWIDVSSGLRIKMESQNNLRIYLADMTVMSKVKQGNWDDIIFIKTNEDIKDIRGIASMSVKADLEVIPASSIEDLDVAGQAFKGEVSGNRVNGVFEVNHEKYSGENALPFGIRNVFEEDVSIYLKPEEMIESDHPELVSLSASITEGSSDIWEAACRISNWVADNIDGSLQGGSALVTFNLGNGACGSQSLLMAALCRAAGIPARVVWGCLYTPEYGGSFGHHGWNEVYMGKSGWIPVDVTIHETDYVDSGHIRLGILKTKATVINFKEMTIQDYTVGS